MKTNNTTQSIKILKNSLYGSMSVGNTFEYFENQLRLIKLKNRKLKIQKIKDKYGKSTSKSF